VELIERRQRWLQVVGPVESDDDSDETFDNHDRDGDVGKWDFDTMKAKGHSGAKAIPAVRAIVEDDSQSSSAPKANVSNLIDEASRNRSMSDSQAGTRQPNRTNGNAAPAPLQASQPATATAPAPVNNGNAAAAPASTRPSALTSVIYPVLSKLLKSNQEEGVIAALAQLKIAFDNAERAKPGITHSLIAQVIETLKR